MISIDPHRRDLQGTRISMSQPTGPQIGASEMAFNLDDVPRVRITFLPTPLVEMKRLADFLGGPRMFIKRDDLTGLALGGNKTRKLEFLLGEAVNQRCDAVITGGAAQSNHCRQTAAAAAAIGLECHLALGGEPLAFPGGNLLLDYLFGATVHWCGEHQKGERIPEIAGRLRAQGYTPYLIPFGGSNATGALGLVAAIAELKEQLSAQKHTINFLIFPSSSGGTHAGIAAGVDLYGLGVQVLGIGIDRGEPGEPPYEADLAALANEVMDKLGLASRYTAGSFQMRYDYLGGGYGVVGDREREAIQLVGKYEGILLDPVYTARAMGGLIDMIHRKEITDRDTVLFWHTGGIPALFEHAKDLRKILPTP
jgi:D-cysteine desulfhydrase family pyridoxal phosphate-dependent enzyme